MYRYETHCHTSPVSRCAKADVRSMLNMYKSLGYAGVFITNHYFGGKRGELDSFSYEEKIHFHFSDYECGVKIGKEIGLPVFFGTEMTYEGSDFLVYGLDKAWFLSHPEIEDMKISEKLRFMAEEGALIIHAHPFREDYYIDHIQLFPRVVHGTEICNACRTDFENKMAGIYAESYGLLHFAGSDAHDIGRNKYAGMQSDEPIADERDFVRRVKAGQMRVFISEISEEI